MQPWDLVGAVGRRAVAEGDPEKLSGNLALHSTGSSDEEDDRSATESGSESESEGGDGGGGEAD